MLATFASDDDAEGQRKERRGGKTRPGRWLIERFGLLLAAPLASERLLGALLLAGLEIVGVALDFLDDVLLLHLSLKTAKSALYGFAILNSYFSQARVTSLRPGIAHTPSADFFIIAAMPRAVLIHWKAEEARQRLARIRAAGLKTELLIPDGMPALRRLRESPPDVFIIDLTRLPSQGRDVAITLRRQRPTRAVPIVFVGGAAEKVEKARALLPDAVYTEWDGIGEALGRALANPPARPVAPGMMAGYSGTPLPRKLGIRSGMTVLMSGSPDGFEETLGEAVRFVRRGTADLALLFVNSRAQLEAQFSRACDAVTTLWIMWPKKTSRAKTDLDQSAVRAFGLGLGWVDYKVCSVDATWSGLKFTKRARPDRHA